MPCQDAALTSPSVQSSSLNLRGATPTPGPARRAQPIKAFHRPLKLALQPAGSECAVRLRASSRPKTVDPLLQRTEYGQRGYSP